MLAIMQRGEQSIRIITLPVCCTGGGCPGIACAPPSRAWPAPELKGRRALEKIGRS